MLADIATNARRGKDVAPISPIALEAVKRFDALFDFERDINGLAADERLERRQQESRPIAEALEEWMRTERAKLSRSSPVAEPIDYMLKRWDGFTSFLGDGRIYLTNNAAERALRGFALGRKAWLFAGSDRGADRAAFMATLITTAKLNDVDPQALLADALARIAAHSRHGFGELLPWNWNIYSDRAELRLSYRPDDAWHGQLEATVISGAFSGNGSAWFSREHLKETFVAALRLFPLLASELPIIEGGFWSKENQGDLEQCHLRIRVQPRDARGSLLLQVDLATESYVAPDHDQQQSVTTRFLTEYVALDTFAVQLEQVLDGTLESAVSAALPNNHLRGLGRRVTLVKHKKEPNPTPRHNRRGA